MRARPSAVLGPVLASAAPILLVGRTEASGSPTCLHTASLHRPIRSKTPFGAFDHVVFCQHKYDPAFGVLS